MSVDLAPFLVAQEILNEKQPVFRVVTLVLRNIATVAVGQDEATVQEVVAQVKKPRAPYRSRETWRNLAGSRALGKALYSQGHENGEAY